MSDRTLPESITKRRVSIRGLEGKFHEKGEYIPMVEITLEKSPALFDLQGAQQLVADLQGAIRAAREGHEAAEYYRNAVQKFKNEML